MNKRRKEALHRRADTYAHGINRYRELAEAIRVAQAFEDGYRAAMRDMRKVVKQCYADNAWQDDPVVRIRSRNHWVRVRVQQFLRPLR